MPEQIPPSDSPQQRAGGCLTRLCWMAFGNVALLVSAILIAKNHETHFSAIDVIFWVIVAGMLVARYADIKWLQGQTADGSTQATMSHWRRYVVLLLVIAVVVWALAHFAAR